MNKKAPSSILFCVIAFIGLLAAPLASADWYMNRADPAGTAVGSGSPILEPSLFWNQTTNGTIWSPPAVVQGVAYFGSDDGYVYALNASTGVQIWNRSLGHISYSTPAVTGSYLFISSNDPTVLLHTNWTLPEIAPIHGYVSLLNASTGEKYWDKTFPIQVSPPTVSGNIVYVTSNEKFYALNERSGDTLWVNQAGDVFAAQAVADGIAYTGGINAYNSTTGDLIWDSSNRLFNFPVVANGIVYGRNFLGEISAFDDTTGAGIWSFKSTVQIQSNPSVSNKMIYFGSDDCHLYALNSTNGNQIWNHTMGNTGVDSSPVTAGDELYLSYHESYNNYNHYSLDAFNATTGIKLWSYNMTVYGLAQLSDPVIDNGTVYVAYGSSIYAFVDASIPPERVLSTITPTQMDSAAPANINDSHLIIAALLAIVIIAVVTTVTLSHYSKGKRKRQS